MPFVKGQPKVGGRKRGSKNKLPAAIEEILATHNCDPIAGLIRVARSTEKKNPQVAAFCYGKLANKIIPDKRAVEHSGPDGGPVPLEIRVTRVER